MILFRYFLRPLIILLGSLPCSLRGHICGFIGGLVSFLPTREREIAKLQLKLFLPPAASSPSLWNIYKNLGINIGESPNLSPLTKEGSVEGFSKEWALSVIKRGKPVIVLTAHTSNWDLLGATAVAGGIPLATIGKKARIASFHALLEFMRGRYGITTLRRDDPQVTRQLIKLLNQGTWVAALIDQDTYVRSRPSPFFRELAQTPDSLAALAQRTEAILLCSFLARKAPGRYEVITHELDPSKPIDEILLEYHRHLEAFLLRYPEQWVWMHKRWRTLPDGSRRNSKEYIHYLKEQLQKRTQ